MTAQMSFDVPCVRQHLIEKGFVFTVRSYDMKDGEVEAVYKCPKKEYDEDCYNCKNFATYKDTPAARSMCNGNKLIGKCFRKKIQEIKTPGDLSDTNTAFHSGFYSGHLEFDPLPEMKWWAVIEKMCKDKPKFLYLVVKI
jgi:hypothetical protein